MLTGILALFLCLQLNSALAIESLDGFLVSAYDDRFRVISPETVSYTHLTLPTKA